MVGDLELKFSEEADAADPPARRCEQRRPDTPRRGSVRFQLPLVASRLASKRRRKGGMTWRPRLKGIKAHERPSRTKHSFHRDRHLFMYSVIHLFIFSFIRAFAQVFLSRIAEMCRLDRGLLVLVAFLQNIRSRELEFELKRK